jgi:hypothetical protein
MCIIGRIGELELLRNAMWCYMGFKSVDISYI